MTSGHIISIAIGGALGALLRASIINILPSTIYSLPYVLILINGLGCLILGVSSGTIFSLINESSILRSIIVTGFLGSFTTFSSFSLEFYQLLNSSQSLLAFIYLGLTFTATLLGFAIGFYTVRIFI